MIEGWECWGCIWDYINPLSVGFALLILIFVSFFAGYAYGAYKEEKRRSDTD